MTNAICHNCNACRSKIFYRVPQSDAKYIQCRECGLIYVDPFPQVSTLKTHYDTVYYPALYQGRGGKASWGAFWYRVPYFDRFFPKPGKLLEVGAGGGDFLALMRERGWGVTGVEISQHAVDAARTNFNLELVCGTIDDIPKPLELFDAIAFYHVLEHVSDPNDVLKKARSLLKPNGYLIIELPHPTGVDAHISKELLSSIVDWPNHLYLFPPRTARMMLRAAGFHIALFDPSFSFVLFKLLRRSKSPLASMADETHGDAASFHLQGHWLRTLAKRIAPGMKFTIIAQKINE